jgi:hypothetical protein
MLQRYARALRRAALLQLLLPASAALATVTGICPDGSVFVAPDHAQVPCAGAKEVDPLEVPPLKPQYLTSPYTWQVYHEQQDPNNPYNLIDSVREIRALRERGSAGDAASGAPLEGAPGATSAPWDDGGAGAGAAPLGGAQLASRGAVLPLDLGIGDQELRDLYQIVELSQEATPASFERRSADGARALRLAFAHSPAFEARLHEAWRTRGGIGASQVLLFTAVAPQPDAFYPNLTFVQGHLTFSPDPADARQLGILEGRLGPLEPNEVVLGYVILPETVRLEEPLDLYWDDRRIAVAFP